MNTTLNDLKKLTVQEIFRTINLLFRFASIARLMSGFFMNISRIIDFWFRLVGILASIAIVISIIIAFMPLPWFVQVETHWSEIKASDIIAFAACVGTAAQAVAARTQNRRSVHPYIVGICSWIDKEARLSLCLKNIGAGPAIFDRLEVNVDEKTYYSDQLDHALEYLLVEKNGISGPLIVAAGQYYSGLGVGAGEVVEIFSVEVDETDFHRRRKIAKAMMEGEIKASYFSLQGEKQTFDSSKSHRLAGFSSKMLLGKDILKDAAKWLPLYGRIKA